MGVYIPNMSKPTECESCPFADSIGSFMPHTCGLTNITLADDFARMDCPLIEIDLVRCEECRYHDEDGWGYGNCQRPSVDYLRTADEDFCSYGERRAE